MAEHLGSSNFALHEVVEVETEFLRELLHGDMAVVDQLAAVLEDLLLRKDPTSREAAAAEPRRGLVDRRVDPCLLEPESGREAGEPTAHDRDARRRRPAGERRESSEHSQADAGDSGPLDDLAPSDSCVLRSDAPHRILDLIEQRCPRHAPSSVDAGCLAGGPVAPAELLVDPLGIEPSRGKQNVTVKPQIR